MSFSTKLDLDISAFLPFFAVKKQLKHLNYERKFKFTDFAYTYF